MCVRERERESEREKAAAATQRRVSHAGATGCGYVAHEEEVRWGGWQELS